MPKMLPHKITLVAGTAQLIDGSDQHQGELMFFEASGIGAGSLAISRFVGATELAYTGSPVTADTPVPLTFRLTGSKLKLLLTGGGPAEVMVGLCAEATRPVT